MSGVLKDIEKSSEKTADVKCPFRLISFSEGLLCFDPWLAEYVKQPEQIIDNWCSSNFRSCPNFLTYQRNLRAGMRKHFML